MMSQYYTYLSIPFPFQLMSEQYAAPGRTMLQGSSGCVPPAAQTAALVCASTDMSTLAHLPRRPGQCEGLPYVAAASLGNEPHYGRGPSLALTAIQISDFELPTTSDQLADFFTLLFHYLVK